MQKGKRARSRAYVVNRIARLLAHRAELHGYIREKQGKPSGKVPFRRKFRRTRLRTMIAYDFETTPIKAGTPKPLYLTAHGAAWTLSTPIESIEHLGEVLTEFFLTAENHGARFVGWNANKYDVYFIGAAVLHLKGYVIRPYLTRSKSLRGMLVEQPDTGRRWEFLDGMAMTGLLVKLSEFLEKFAPELPKLTHLAPDWENELFDARNPDHVAYAERDSEGLFAAMHRADGIVRQAFDVGLQPTIGNTGIRIFQAHIPEGIQCWEPILPALRVLRDYAVRGGYCYCARPHDGKIWKYDVNQAYAAAMRETALPAGRLFHTDTPSRERKCAIYRITATKPGNIVPFYYRATPEKSALGYDAISDTWITSVEYEQLVAEKWNVNVIEGWVWEEGFSMHEYVGKLETLRMSAADGPGGPLGTLCKAIGNNSFGKSLEQLDGLELRLSLDPPGVDWSYYGTEEDDLQHVWFKLAEPFKRDYHQPQIGAFITAHVRMVVRRAALLAPESFLYADTDCVVFDSPVDLPIDPKRYGFWKIECEGEHYRIINKKVYASADGKTKRAKGMSVDKLTAADFEAWSKGSPPVQVQRQRVNFLRAMAGADMFVERPKVGERKR